MDNIFIVAGIISVIFILTKFLEMRFIDAENKKPLKLLVRDSILVYFSVVIGNFIIEQVSPNINELNFSDSMSPAIFMTEPDF